MSILDHNQNYEVTNDEYPPPGKFFWFSGYDLANRRQPYAASDPGKYEPEVEEQQPPYQNGNLEAYEDDEIIYDQPLKYIPPKNDENIDDVYEIPVDGSSQNPYENINGAISPYQSPRNLNGPLYANIPETNASLDDHIYETADKVRGTKGTYFKLNGAFPDSDSENETEIVPVQTDVAYEEPAHQYAEIPNLDINKSIDYTQEALPREPMYSDEPSPMQDADELSPNDAIHSGTWFRFSGRNQHYTRPIAKQIDIETSPKQSNDNVNKIKPQDDTNPIESNKHTVNSTQLDEQFKFLDRLVLESFDDLELDIESEIQAPSSPIRSKYTSKESPVSPDVSNISNTDSTPKYQTKEPFEHPVQQPKPYQPSKVESNRPVDYVPKIPKPYVPKQTIDETVTTPQTIVPVSQTPDQFESTPVDSPRTSRKKKIEEDVPNYKDLLSRFNNLENKNQPQTNNFKYDKDKPSPHGKESDRSSKPAQKGIEKPTDFIANKVETTSSQNQKPLAKSTESDHKDTKDKTVPFDERVKVFKDETKSDTESFPKYTVIIKEDGSGEPVINKASSTSSEVEEAIVEPVRQKSVENAPPIVDEVTNSNTFPRKKTSKASINISVKSVVKSPIKTQDRSKSQDTENTRKDALPERIMNKRQKGTPIKKSKSFSHVPRKRRGEEEELSFASKLSMFNKKSLDDEDGSRVSPREKHSYDSPTQRRLFGKTDVKPHLVSDVDISPVTIESPDTPRKSDVKNKKDDNTVNSPSLKQTPKKTQSIDVQAVPRSTKRVYTRSKTEDIVTIKRSAEVKRSSPSVAQGKTSIENVRSPSMGRHKLPSVKSPGMDKKKAFSVNLNQPDKIIALDDPKDDESEIAYTYENYLSSDGKDFIDAYLKDVNQLEDSIQPREEALNHEEVYTKPREQSKPIEERLTAENVSQVENVEVEWADLDRAFEQSGNNNKQRNLPISQRDSNSPSNDKTRVEVISRPKQMEQGNWKPAHSREKSDPITQKMRMKALEEARRQNTTPTPRSLKRQHQIVSGSSAPKQSESEDFDYTSGEDDQNMNLQRNRSFRRSITIEDVEGSGHRRRKSTGGTVVSVFFTPISPTQNTEVKDGHRTICQQYKKILTYLDHMVITQSNFASDFEAVKRMHSLFWELKKSDDSKSISKSNPKSQENMSSVMNYLVVQEWPKIMLGCLKKLKSSYPHVFQECKDIENIIYYSGHLPSLLRMNRTSSEFAVSVIFDGLLKAAINFTDVHEASRIACCEDNLIGYLLEDVVPTLRNIHWGKVAAREMFLKSISELVYNCSQTASNAGYMIEHDCVNVFTELCEETFDIVDARKVYMTMLLSLSYFIDNNNYDIIIPNEDSIIRLLQFLDKSLEHSEHSYHDFTAKELAGCLARLAGHDSNKILITRNSGQEILHKLLKYSYTDEERIAALHAIWNLSFSHEAKDILRGMGKLKNLLNELKTSQNPVIRRAANGILWECEEKYDIKGSRESYSSTPHHVMLTYEYEAQPLVIGIRDELHRRGYTVWMNTDGDERGLQEVMTRGVEKSTVVIMALTRKYKQSPHTFAEIDYAHTLRKKIVPLLIDNDYVPDGWLSEYVETQQTFDFSRRSMFNGSLDALMEYIKQFSEGKDGRASSLLNDHTSGKKRNQDVLLWSNDDVIDWLKENQLIRSVSNTSRLRKFTGLHLLMFFDLKKESPDYYYSILDSHLGFKDVLDTLEFTYALDRLLCAERLI